MNVWYKVSTLSTLQAVVTATLLEIQNLLVGIHWWDSGIH